MRKFLNIVTWNFKSVLMKLSRIAIKVFVNILLGLKPRSHLRFGTRLGCDSRAIRDGDVIVLRLGCDSAFELHLKFLSNRICFKNLRASLVALEGFFDPVNKLTLLWQSSSVLVVLRGFLDKPHSHLQFERDSVAIRERFDGEPASVVAGTFALQRRQRRFDSGSFFLFLFTLSKNRPSTIKDTWGLWK